MEHLGPILDGLSKLVESGGKTYLTFLTLAAVIIAFLSARWFDRDHVAVRMAVLFVIVFSFGMVPFIVDRFRPKEAVTDVATVHPLKLPDKTELFFEWDKAIITPESIPKLNMVAAEYLKRSAVEIFVVGYGFYNEVTPAVMTGDSRSKAVQAALVARGIPANRINVLAGGVVRMPVRAEVPEFVFQHHARRVEITFGRIE